MYDIKDLRIRDPFILIDDGTYYLYATTGEKTLSYYYGTDLKKWEYGGEAFVIADDSWAYKDVWAAEVHRYKGRFYLFVSLLGKNGLRATQIAVADMPEGPFVPVVNHGATPKDKSCIDGTLYVQDGVPYIVYSHDWPDNYIESTNSYVGEICAAELSDDLAEIVGEPWVLFGSDESPISKATPHILEYNGKISLRYGSDAPFLRKLKDGKLLLVWSPYLNGNYVVLQVVSESGDIRGKWEHVEAPLFDQNGGHAMFFDTPNGKTYMCLHAPDNSPFERVHIYEVEECKDGLKIVKEI